MMISEDFARGFRYELANRAFALRATNGVARRLDDDPRRCFWASYARLEQFNAPRYREAARRWGMDPSPRAWTRFRGAASGAAPKALLNPLLKLAHPMTVDYVAELRRLRTIGPEDGDAFLGYVVDQEVLQVEMMRLAIAGRHNEVVHLVESFLAKNRARRLFR